jgi:hypothetical protein
VDKVGACRRANSENFQNLREGVKNSADLMDNFRKIVEGAQNTAHLDLTYIPIINNRFIRKFSHLKLMVFEFDSNIYGMNFPKFV